MKKYPLKYLPQGFIFLDASDDCLTVAKLLDRIGYMEEFIFALDFDPLFVARMMAAGFLVMSEALPHNETADTGGKEIFILTPKHHLLRSCLFFPELHIKKSIRRFLGNYTLFYDRDFDLIIDKCVAIHGDGWLTPPLLKSIREIRNDHSMPVRPVSFALYRDNCLSAGEFGIVSGNVYTSYSGFHEEKNSGTVQMILTAQYLERNNFSFWDLGMPLDYKLTLGAWEITRTEFLEDFLGE